MEHHDPAVPSLASELIAFRVDMHFQWRSRQALGTLWNLVETKNDLVDSRRPGLDGHGNRNGCGSHKTNHLSADAQRM